MWEGRGATARPREAKWSSGVADVFLVHYNKHVFKDPFGHHVHYLTVLYNMDMCSYGYEYILGIRLPRGHVQGMGCNRTVVVVFQQIRYRPVDAKTESNKIKQRIIVVTINSILRSI